MHDDEYREEQNREIYYQGQNRKAMELAWLWLLWVVLPTVIIFVAYCIYSQIERIG